MPEKKPTPGVSPLTRTQVDTLLLPINPVRVLARDGNHHLESYDVRAHLTRVFGFGGWSGEVIDTTLLFEDRHMSKPGRNQNADSFKPWEQVSVGYRVRYRLTIYVWQHGPDGTQFRSELAVYTEEATGDASNFPLTKWADAHDFAVKTAESQAFKRCAINLGDQFGLGLYSKGWKPGAKPLVKSTLVGWEKPDDDSATTAAVVDEVEQVQGHDGLPETMIVNDAERDWIDQAAALAGDPVAVGALWNEARAAGVRPQVLAAIRAYAGEEPEG